MSADNGAAPVAAALVRARELADSGQRAVLAVAGPPGAGKSTVAQRVVDECGEIAAYLPMDGFHLTNAELERLERRERKGAIDTFDAAGFVTTLRRVRSASETVYAPLFDRTVEEPIAGAIAIPRQARLIVVEGNYLLIDREPWSQVRTLCDETWYVEMDEDVRTEGLVERHVRFGMPRPAAEQWVRDVDQRNGELVETSRDNADVVVRVEIGAAA